MSRRTLPLTDPILAYLLDATVQETDSQRRLRDETARLSDADMQISPEQGQFMKFLVELLNARQALEIGTFTGYSSIWIAMGLPDDGRLICCDVSKERTDMARRYWAETGLEKKIKLQLGPALETLDKLRDDMAIESANGDPGLFDFAFIDADKQNSEAYYERVLELLRPGGIFAMDNAFHGGRVADPNVKEIDVPHRILNRKIANDPRVSVTLVPIGDGLLLARKR